MKHHKDTDERAELRDIFAGLAMHSLIDTNQKNINATPAWVATQAYRYADAMLDTRDAVSHTKSSKDTLINECQPY